ncbi:hypothetical protein ASF57_12250 [Methylobacterium sp. Leaf117]|nr:hypothetical protein ASF57_12250 [Methylobacterium sp. Leaf117]
MFSKADLAGTAGLTGTALDRITDFQGAGAAGGDTLVFRGFAADANVVEIARQGTLHTYEIREHGAAVGRFTAVHAGNALTSGDFVLEDSVAPETPPVVVAPPGPQPPEVAVPPAPPEPPVVVAPPVVTPPVVDPPVVVAPPVVVNEPARASVAPTSTIKANNAVQALNGTAGHDDIWGWDKGGAVLTGGTGDDTYHIWQSSDQVVRSSLPGATTPCRTTSRT